MLTYPLLFGSLGWPEILIIVLAVLVLFGAKKIPEFMKSVGKGVKSFKEGINDIDDKLNEVDDSKKQ